MKRERAVSAGVVVSLTTMLSVGLVGAAKADPVDDWLAGDYATGDWGGVRTQLNEAGITPELTYTTDILALLKGGVDDGNGSSYAGQAELNLDFDLTGFT